MRARGLVDVLIPRGGAGLIRSVVEESTVPVMHAMVEAGADVIELGVPFSDPMADGPVIQQASERALAKGIGLRQVFDEVKAFSRALAEGLTAQQSDQEFNAALDASIDGRLCLG